MHIDIGTYSGINVALQAQAGRVTG